MNATKQNDFISRYLWKHLTSMDCCYFDSKEQVTQEVRDNVGRLREGDTIAVELVNEEQTLRKVSGFACLHDIDSDAFVVDFHTLENEYYEQLRR